MKQEALKVRISLRWPHPLVNRASLVLWESKRGRLCRVYWRFLLFFVTLYRFCSWQLFLTWTFLYFTKQNVKPRRTLGCVSIVVSLDAVDTETVMPRNTLKRSPVILFVWIALTSPSFVTSVMSLWSTIRGLKTFNNSGHDFSLFTARVKTSLSMKALLSRLPGLDLVLKSSPFLMTFLKERERLPLQVWPLLRSRSLGLQNPLKSRGHPWQTRREVAKSNVKPMSQV